MGAQEVPGSEGASLPMMPADRRCRPSSLDNRARRALSPASRLLDLLAPRDGERVADLGAGVGYYDAEILRRIGPNGTLYVADIDDANLEIARRKIGKDPRVVWHVGSAADLRWLADGSVDRVMLSLVLCCLADKTGALRETWRILRPGGSAVVTFPYAPRAEWGSSGYRGLGLTRGRFLSLAGSRTWSVERLPGHAVRKYRLTKPPKT